MAYRADGWRRLRAKRQAISLSLLRVPLEEIPNFRIGADRYGRVNYRKFAPIVDDRRAVLPGVTPFGAAVSLFSRSVVAESRDDKPRRNGAKGYRGVSLAITRNGRRASATDTWPTAKRGLIHAMQLLRRQYRVAPKPRPLREVELRPRAPSHRNQPAQRGNALERAKGIEPLSRAGKTLALPLSYTRCSMT